MKYPSMRLCFNIPIRFMKIATIKISKLYTRRFQNVNFPHRDRFSQIDKPIFSNFPNGKTVQCIISFRQLIHFYFIQNWTLLTNSNYLSIISVIILSFSNCYASE